MIEGERPLPKESAPPPEPPQEDPSFFAKEVRVPPENLPPITFLYFRHKVENADKILEEVKDADLLLIEQVGGTPEERGEEEAFQNLILSPGFGRHQPERRIIEDLLSSDDDYFILLGRLAGSGKRIKFIDIPSTHPAFETFRKSQEVKFQVEQELGKDIHKAYQTFHLATDLTIQSYKESEDYVLRQLSDLMADLKEREGGEIRKIAVVQGPAHTSVHHRFKKTFPEAQVGYKTEGPLLVHTPENILIRRGLLFPNQEIPEIEYQRTFLAIEIFYPSYFLHFSITEQDSQRVYEKALSLAQKLSPQEVGEVFEDYEQKLKERQGRGRRRSPEEISSLVTSKWAEKKGVKLPPSQETT